MRAVGATKRALERQLWLWRHRRGFVERDTVERPRLLVDVSTIARHDAQTGIQRVVRAVWSELRLRHSSDFDVVPVFATQRRGYCYAAPDFLEAREPGMATQPVAAGPADKFLGLDLSAHFLPKYRRQLSAWRRNGASVHLIVYDVLPLSRPEWFNTATVRHFRNWFDVLANDADEAICISRQVAQDLRDRFRHIGHGKMPSIRPMKLGGDIAASRPTTGKCDNIRLVINRMQVRPSILMVGTVEPRKGYDVALKAFEHLWREGSNTAPDLVIVGKPGWKTEALQDYIRRHPEHGKRLVWLDQVSDEGLCCLYDNCRGLLMTSHAEGVGLPLLEAAMRRLHILARDLPVFREQDLPNVTLFDDDCPEHLGKLVGELGIRGQQRPRLTADLPSWSGSVDGLLEGFRFGEPGMPSDRLPAERDRWNSSRRTGLGWWWQMAGGRTRRPLT